MNSFFQAGVNTVRPYRQRPGVLSTPTRRMKSLTALWLASFIAGASGLMPANAARVVNSLKDVPAPPPGQVTLRSALAQAASGESIVFDPSLDGCTIELSIVGQEHSTLVAEVMGITNTPSGPISYLVGYLERDYGRSALYARKNVVIDASALPLGIAVKWGGGDLNPARVLAVYGDLTLKNVSIAGGRSVAVELPAPDPADPYAQLSTHARGAALAVWGVARLEHCRLYGNACSRASTVPARSRDSGVFGGGIYADIVQISDCVISGNAVTASGVSGGGIFSVGGAKASGSVSTVERTVVTGNAICGINAYGGGVYSDGGGIGNLKTLKLLNCTIAGNRISFAGPPSSLARGYWRGGGVYMSNGYLVMQSCTVVENEVYGVPRTDALGKPNLAGGIAATIGNAHAVECMTIGHSILAGNSVHESTGAVYNEDLFTGSLFEFVSLGHNRIGAINFSQILVPIGVKNWYSLCRKHYPKQGDRDGVALADVLDLSGGITHSSDILSAGVGASNPAVLHYVPKGDAIDQVPASTYSLGRTYAEYEVESGADNFLEIMLGRVENHYGPTNFAASFTTDFEAFLAAVDIDATTPGNQPYTDTNGVPILTLADTRWLGPSATWPSQLWNYPYIQFWHRLDMTLEAEGIAGMGPELLGDDAWQALFDDGYLDENPSLRLRLWTSSYSATPLAADQTGTSRPANGLGDIGAIEFEPPTPPLLRWNLEEGSSTNTAEAVSGKTNVAALAGSCVWTNGIAAGSSNAVLLGSNGYIEAGTLKTNGDYVAGSHPDFAVASNRWTLTAWINLSPRQGLSGDRVIASSDAGPGPGGWRLFTREADGVPESLGFDFAGTRIDSFKRVPVGVDVFVAVASDSSGLDGSLHKHRFAIWDGSIWQFSLGTAFSAIRLRGLELGAVNGVAAFQGTIDDVRIYGQALNQSELDRLTQADTDGDGDRDYLDSDDDNDGLTDTSEAAIGTDSKNPDSDGDGARDRDEVIAGTDPSGVDSLFKIDDITRSGTNVVICWSSVSNRTYSLFGASSLTSNDWRIVDSGITSTVPLNAHAVPPPPDGQFFKVGVE